MPPFLDIIEKNTGGVYCLNTPSPARRVLMFFDELSKPPAASLQQVQEPSKKGFNTSSPSSTWKSRSSSEVRVKWYKRKRKKISLSVPLCDFYAPRQRCMVLRHQRCIVDVNYTNHHAFIVLRKHMTDSKNASGCGKSQNLSILTEHDLIYQ